MVYARVRRSNLRATVIMMALVVALGLSMVAGAQGAEKVTLRQLTASSPQSSGGILDRQIVKENPYVKVEVDYTEIETFPEKFLAMTLAGDWPDFVFMDSQMMPLFADTGLLAELDSYVKEWPDCGNFFQAVKEAGTYHGIQYGIPLGNYPWGLLWRKDYFAKYGIPGPPETRDQLVEYGAKISNAAQAEGKDIWGFGITARYGRVCEDFTGRAWAYTGGENIVVDEKVGDKYVWKRNVTAEELEPLFKWYGDLMSEGVIPPDSRAWLPGDNDGSYAVGRIAMVELGPWEKGRAEMNPEFLPNTGIAMPPAGPKGKYAVISPWTMGITLGSKLKDEAFKVLTWISNRENSTKRAMLTGAVPTRSDTVEDFADDWWVQGFIKNMEYGKPIPATPFREMVFIISETVARVTYGEMTPLEAAQEFCDRVDRMVARVN